MLRMRTGAPRGLRWGLFGLAGIIGFLAVASDPADARSRRKRAPHKPAPAAAYKPPYAAIVIDGNSGAIVHSENPDALRHPASLTKIMTLYVLFERLETGKLKLDSELKVSAHAALQAPTKLGVKPGQTIAVEDAIKAIVTRSANDVAVVVAENIAGDEDSFAELMTHKAKSLGMTRTVYQNASGLPDNDQVTTARDQAVLGRAIQERFPRYYRYFSTRTFVYQGSAIRNHNHLLGNIEGVDGIKTGYTRASGFNLVTSVRRGNRYVVAVVLGGASAGSRDARMRQLIGETIVQASVKRTGPMLAEAAERQPPAKVESKVESKPEPRSEPTATSAARYAVAGMSVPFRLPSLSEPKARQTAAPAMIPSPRPAPTTGSTDPIRPVLVRTLSVRSGAVQTASAAPVQLPPMPVEPEPAVEPAAPPPATIATPAPAAKPAAKPAARQATGSVPESAPALAEKPAPAPAKVRTGWFIQVGAYPAEEVAKQRLVTVKSKASRLLGAADPFTETVLKDGTTYYRARFAGFNQPKAEAACRYLKRNDVECIIVRN